MRSIATRLLIGNGIVLAAFVVLTALAVSWSVHQRAETARFDRLQGLIYGILGATELGQGATLVVDANALPERRLNQAVSGLYAELVGNDGRPLWRSRSSITRQPGTQATPIGEWRFERLPRNGDQPAVDSLQLQSIWELDSGEELPFIVHVADEGQSLGLELARFDRTLWVSLAGAALALLALQSFVLKRGLAPLTRIGEQVDAIEKGERDRLDTDLPSELAPLAGGLNALLASERGRRSRYRDMLDDLAHSLKTPLTILGNLVLDGGTSDAATVREQTARMRTSIDRSLERATRQSVAVLPPPLPAVPVLEGLTRSLDKLHGNSELRFDIDVPPTFTVRVADPDLHEILGNVLENACKYGATLIRVSCDASARTLIVDDDGPGFPDDHAHLLHRGVRADTRRDGQGIGLAASRELLIVHGGELSLGKSPFGGARVVLSFATAPIAARTAHDRST